jgi:hypothetical protein
MAARRFFRPHMRRRKLSWLPPYDSNVPSSGNSGAPSPRWLDGNEMVETVGLEPTSACLQNRRADPALPPNNPGIFRTKWCLKMESNHRRARLQRAALPLSYPGNRGADGGNRTCIPGAALQGPANGPRPHFEMVGNRGIEPRTRKGAGFTGPLSHQTWRYPEVWRRAEESNPHPEGATVFKTAGRPSRLDSPI